MDSDHHQNWLAFSLSNHSLFQPTPTLFFNPTIPCGGVAVNSTDPENGTSSATFDHLAGEGPKLEDFLSGSGGAAATSNFDGGLQPVYDDDSDFKKLAATFLAGFSPPKQAAPPPAKKAVETIGHRTSVFRGVTRHRWTGRYEAHLWDNSCRREGQSRKGRQGGYDKEEKAARAYDLAALKYWGPTTTTNFPVSDYEKEMEEMKNMTRQEFVASLRRKSSGFSRGASIYRGVTRHHQHGRWQARIGRVAGNKDLYLGTFSTQEEAAEAYDIAAIKFRGVNAVTNFDMTRYDVKSIASSNLPVGGTCNKSKTSSESDDNKTTTDVGTTQLDVENNSKDRYSAVPFQSQMNFAMPIKQDQSSSLWAALGYRNLNSASNSQGTTPFSMEFDPPNNRSNDQGFFNVGNYYQQQSNGTSSGSGSDSLVLSGNNGTTHDASLDLNGNWTPLQPVKPAFQTPIFGME
ncbi:hypothetical protein RD792_012748 [Penstemon davidsonii]|uniref:AP2/ERF domain-containing protein n=1 Tax=Penstemon davidsonii TaxID=160366 RepID=A0ABR0CXS0_9LAMI|nr:hypothetical protein RD792_012748 [Penstemon davidsonii]